LSCGHQPALSFQRRDHTRQLREVGEIMGVRVLDHIIIGKGRYCSFVDRYW
jgi:DNA repair protein RadC